MLRDAAFFAALAAYTGAALLLLALGAAPAIVRAVPGLHDTLHELGGGDTWVVAHVVREHEYVTWTRRVWFRERELALRANTPILITLSNEAPDPHNVSLYDGERLLFQGQFDRGAGSQQTVPYTLTGYTFTAPPPGTYRFRSDSDPAMGGSVVVVADERRLAEPLASFVRTLARLAHGAETGPLADSERPRPATQGERRALAAPFEYVFSALNVAFGLFLVRLRPRDAVARLLAIGMIGTAAVFNLQAHGAIDLMPALAELMHDNFHVIVGLAYAVALLLFPDGLRPASGWLGWLAVSAFVLIGFLTWLLASWGHGDPATFATFFGVLIPLAGITSQAWRYGHPASATERQQSRVLIFAFGFVLITEVILVGVLAAAGQLTGAPALTVDDFERVAFLVFPPLFALIPFTLVLVLVRYRLWDIDRLVDRAFFYAVLTGVLAAAYTGIVILLQPLLGTFTQGSDLAIALSTLAVATLFQPVRSNLQDLIDRGFYRHRYDTARLLEDFSVRLRDEVDLEAVRADLIDAVRETVEPAHATVWLRER